MREWEIDTEGIADDVERKLDKIIWVKEYEIFVHSVIRDSFTNNSMNGKMNYGIQEKSGVAIRILTAENRIQEFRAGLPQIRNITNNLLTPKSGIPASANFEFPRIANHSNLALSKMETIDEGEIVEYFKRSSQFNLPYIIEHAVIAEQEQSTILNSASPYISRFSERTYLQFTIEDRERRHILSRTQPIARTRFVFKEMERSEIEGLADIQFQIDSRLKHAELRGKKILISPKIIGNIVLDLAEIVNYGSKVDKLVGFPEDLNLTDEPRKRGGFYDYKIDDVGQETTDHDLLEESMTRKNYFRSSSFRTFTRGYDYPLRSSATNVVLSGGIGKTSDLMEYNLYFIKDGKAEVFEDRDNFRVLIQATETEEWHGGVRVNSVGDFSFSILLSDLLTNSVYTADQHCVAEPSKPGAAYVGSLLLHETTNK